MHTNTSPVMTAFSALKHDSDLVYPSNRDILDYLHRYAEMFGPTSHIRFGSRVNLLRRDDTGWLVDVIICCRTSSGVGLVSAKGIGAGSNPDWESLTCASATSLKLVAL